MERVERKEIERSLRLNEKKLVELLYRLFCRIALEIVRSTSISNEEARAHVSST